MDPFNIPRLMGVTVIAVPNLTQPAVYVPGVDVALIKEGLCPHLAEEAAGWILSAHLDQIPTAR